MRVGIAVSALVLAATGCSAAADDETPTASATGVEALDTAPVPDDVPASGELVCETLPETSVELALSGREVISVESDIRRAPGEGDDGPVVEATCEVFVRGQAASALSLYVFGPAALPQDVRQQVDAGLGSTFPPDQVVGLVEQLDERVFGDGDVEPASSRARILVGPQVRGAVDPLVLTVVLRPQTTGRDEIADSAALSLQAAQVLDLPLLDREAADAVLPALPTQPPTG